MLRQCLSLILLHFLATCITEKAFLKSNSHVSGEFKNLKRIKRNVDLEIYSNISEFNAEKRDNEIYNVCVKCPCQEDTVTCWHYSSTVFQNLNIQASQENFIPKIVRIIYYKISVLEKNNIFPINKETIETLSFTATDIQDIKDGAFDELSSLKVLEFKDCKISTALNENILSPKLGTTLLKFKFAEITMEEFDPRILKNLFNLVGLDLNTNYGFNGRIDKEFPESLSKLKVLNLVMCKLNYLNEHVFDNLLNLENLNLHYNKFTLIPSAINKLSNLKILNFCRNFIETLKKNSFEGNSNLEVLMLGDNPRLHAIEDCAFCKLPNLRVINFYSSHYLTFINENTFGSITYGGPADTKEFSIEGCNVRILHEKLLDWKNIEKLSLNNNPFACNCSNAWLFNDLLSNNSIYESHLSSKYGYGHHKYTLGCMGPPPITANHTHPLSLVDIFASCNSSNNFNFIWVLIMLVVVICCIVTIWVFVNHQNEHTSSQITHLCFFSAFLLFSVLFSAINAAADKQRPSLLSHVYKRILRTFKQESTPSAASATSDQQQFPSNVAKEELHHQLSESVADENEKYTFKSPRPQRFSLPENIVYYMARNSINGQCHQNVILSCKLLFHMSRIIPVERCEPADFSWDIEIMARNKFNRVKRKYINHEEEYSSKLWIYDKLDMFYSSKTQPSFASTLTKHVYGFSLKELTLKEQVLTLGELQILTAGGGLKDVWFENNVIKNDDGSAADFEKVFEVLCCKNMIIKLPLEHHGVDKDTATELIKVLESNGREYSIGIQRIPEVFDIEIFFGFLKANMYNRELNLNLSFADTISIEYKLQLQTFVNEILQIRGIYAHTVPFISYSGPIRATYRQFMEKRHKDVEGILRKPGAF